MTAFKQSTMAFGLAACLLPGLLGLAGCASASEGAPADEPTEQQQAPGYTVEVPALDGDALLVSLSDSDSDAAALVTDARLAVDPDARHVDLTVRAATSDTADLCAAGEAVARCLSDQARVARDDGAMVPDDGPCGALFEAYGLSVRVEGLTSADVLDGLLPAGGDEVTWQ